MNTRDARTLMLAMLPLLAWSGMAGAGDIYVDDDTCPATGDGTAGNPYCSIQYAIDNAGTGDTVHVAAGMYPEQLYIDKSLDLTGAGIGATVLQAVPVVDRAPYSITQWSGSARTIDACIGVADAGLVNISGLTVDGLDLGTANFYGIHFFNTSGSVTACEITDVTHSASPGTQSVVSLVATHGVGESFTIDISNNVIPEFQKGGIVIMGPGATFTVNGNTVSGVVSSSIAGNCIQLSYGATGSTLGNTVDGTAYSGSDWASTGILLFESGDIQMTADEVFDCESGVNFSDWGWIHLHPSPVNLTFTGLNLHDNEWTLGAQLSRDNSDVNITVTDCDIINATGDGIDIWGTAEDPWGGAYYTGWSNGDLNVSITGCNISGAAIDGIWTADLSGNANNVNYFGVNNTSLKLNAASAINNNFASLIDASGCWWNDAGGPVPGTPLDRTERRIAPLARPYGDQLPASAVVLHTESNLNGALDGETIFGPVDYTPWMANDGSYTTPGFEGDFSELWVDDDSPQAGSTGRAQEGVDLASGSIVHLAPGTYEEQVVIDESDLHLIGAGSGTDPAANSIIQCPPVLTWSFMTSAANFPIIGLDGVTGGSIENLRIDGLGRGNANYRFTGVGFWNSGGDIVDCVITNVQDTPFSGAQHGVGVYTFNNTGGPYTINLTDTVIDEFQKNATALSGEGLTANVSGCTVTGKGPTGVTAQNGIQISWGAGGTVTDSSVSDIGYTGANWSASGMLFLRGTTVDVSGASTVSNTQCAIVFDETSGSVDGAAVDSGDIDSAEGISVRDYGATAAMGTPTHPAAVSPYDDGYERSRGAPTSVDVSNCVLTGVHHTETYGVAAWALGDDVTVTINGSKIADWDTGIVAYEDGSVVSVTAHGNTIADNDSLGFWANSAGVQDAENNWWGHVMGPLDPDGLEADEAGSPPCYDPSTMRNLDAEGNGNGVTDLNVDYCPWMDGSPFCGDGVIDPGEECDDGNSVNEDNCLNACLFNTCGDTYVDLEAPGVEECDDGNTEDGDCCSSACEFEADGSPCNPDDDLCTIEECDGSGTCVHTGDVDCQDPVPPCEGGEQCNPNTGQCDTLPDAPWGTPCPDDDNECTDDYCDGGGSCTHPANGLCGVCCIPANFPFAQDPECNDQVIESTCVTLGGVFVVGPGTECLGDSDGDTVDDQCDVCPGKDDLADRNRNDIQDCLEPDLIPTVSEWGLVTLALLLLTGAKVVFRQRRRPA